MRLTFEICDSCGLHPPGTGLTTIAANGEQWDLCRPCERKPFVVISGRRELALKLRARINALIATEMRLNKETHVPHA